MLTQSGAPGCALAGPISHTSTQYIDVVDFLYFTGFVYHLLLSAAVLFKIQGKAIFRCTDFARR